ncbi:lactonase family protein [Neorhodopirellula pilleata]|uniref:6-phosphogluconolactonase n=1 Tax=Neorhodopirellula pilleata TaxID=2714738 RepID=A0A5C6AY84_9BACT|nr:lactonase family protein [Neorhodopirellula pilleata]TWU03104.1 6-phosphogluconolactonase [Neorhodopirellula pilleata]
MNLRFCTAAILCLAGCLSAHSDDRYRVYLGTYTDDQSKGIYQCEFNATDGSLSSATLAAETSSPSFLAFHPNNRFLYAVNERTARISAFQIDPSTGNLTLLNSQPSQGGAPCHLVVDPTGKNVLVANYTGGSCLCVPISPDGSLGDATSFQQHVGERTHAHSIHVDAANRYALCCDLGLDQVITYRFDPEQGMLASEEIFDAPKGSGPRHFAWHPSGNTAFINGESNLTIIRCRYDASSGKLTQQQVLSTLPADVIRNGGSTAETVVHPSGKFVYVSNRNPYNSIAIFAIDSDTHELSVVGHQSSGIQTPRNFAIDPTGNFMLVANQSGGNVIVFRINPSTGQLTPTQTSVRVANPVCVRFMKLEVEE